jgi:hypothetical protein
MPSRLAMLAARHIKSFESVEKVDSEHAAPGCGTDPWLVSQHCS